MSLVELPDDLLRYILEFLESTRERLRVTNLCKSTRITLLKTISLKPSHDGMEFIRVFLHHIRSIERVHVIGQTNPHLWIPKFPKLVKIENCDLTTPFIPDGGRECETEILIFKNFNTDFQTDWSLFPKLKNVYIYANSVDYKMLKDRHFENLCITYKK